MNSDRSIIGTPAAALVPQAAYVHVPFCSHRCGYCDFTVITRRDDLLQSYLEGLEREMNQTLGEPHPVKTLFIGGGTPTYLPADLLQRLLKLLHYWLPLEPGGEYSIEANPAGFDNSRMEVLAEAGVNRVSLGVQSMQSRHLLTLERDHTPADVEDVVCRLRQHRFLNIALDLIYGVPDQTVPEWIDTLHESTRLAPEHLSTYGLTFEKGTSFWARRRHGEIRPALEETELAMYAAAIDKLPTAGYLQYELSNFARPGFECRHNQVYWRAEPFFGFGPGAASDDGRVRRVNHRSVTTWLKRVLGGNSGEGEREELSSEERAREAVMLGLRQVPGIDLAAFEARFGHSVRSLGRTPWDRFLESGHLQVKSGRVSLTRTGRFIADTIILEFL